jgi:hypothetical protein
VSASSGPKGEVARRGRATAGDRRPVGPGGAGPAPGQVEVVATAWSGDQASQWHGEQAVAFSHANPARVESTRAANLANPQTEIDVATFTQWVNAYARHQTRLAEFYRRRFRPEFQPAVTAWVASRPLTNPDAPRTPFAMPNYRLAATAPAERLQRAAETAAAEATRELDHTEDYVLAVVLFSAPSAPAGTGPARGPWSWASAAPGSSAPWWGWRASR